MKHNLKKNEKKKKVVFINGWRKMCSMVLIFSMAVSLGAGYVSSQRVEAKAYDTSMSQFNKQSAYFLSLQHCQCRQDKPHPLP